MTRNKKLVLLIIIFSLIIAAIVYVDVSNYKNEGIRKDEEATKIDEEYKENKEKEKENQYGFNLPVVVIDTHGEKINYENKIPGEISIYNDERALNYLTDKPQLQSKIQIKVRGNTTRHFPKKQYGIEFEDEDGNPKNQEVLGMPKESDWVFNAPFADKSLIRNYLAYNASGKIMDYASRARFCEVFVKDDGSETLEEKHYKGLYVILEKVKRDEERVNINKEQKQGNETSFIISKNRKKANDTWINNYGIETYLYDYNLLVEYPNEPSEEQLDYINKTVSKFERVLYSGKYDVIKEGYEEYIDVDSFVDYYLINEFFKNTDAGILSSYFYKEYGEKIKAGPVWDFNRSMGNYVASNEEYNSPSGFYMAQTSWFDRLLQDKKFVSKVLKRYKALRKTYLSDEYLLSIIDGAVSEIGPAANRNFLTWPMELCNQADNFKVKTERFEGLNNDPKVLMEYFKGNPNQLMNTYDLATSYDEEIEKLKLFIVERGQWIDKNINSLYKWTD